MSIPLGRAVLCADCAHLSASKGDKCDHCGSSAIYPLHRWIEAITEKNVEIAVLEQMYSEVRGETK